jgi:hypothetical protein
VDALIAEVAAGQHGIVTAAQLRSCGLERGGAERRLAARRLQRLYRGVYAFGHRELTAGTADQILTDPADTLARAKRALEGAA